MMARRIGTLIASAALALSLIGLAGCGNAPAAEGASAAGSADVAASTAEVTASATGTTEADATGTGTDDAATEGNGTGDGGLTVPATNGKTGNAGTSEAGAATPADGSYEIAVDTDSSMFRAESCTLTVVDGTYVATLTLPGEGFSRLFFGTAEEAVVAPDADIYDYRLDDEGRYTFDLPVPALDEELEIAAFGHRRDTWYDHTIVFHAPDTAQ